MKKSEWIGTTRRGIKIISYEPSNNSKYSIIHGYCVVCKKPITTKRYLLENLSSGYLCNCSSKVFHHGMSKTRIFRIYAKIKDRTVLNTGNKTFIENYIKRGISLCDEWQGRNGFMNFYEWSMSHGYQDNLSIDRIDNDKGYSPDNCRWTNQHVQNCNRRNTLKATINGETKAVSDWCIELGMNYETVYGRIRKGWSTERALLEPINERYVHYKKGNPAEKP